MAKSARSSTTKTNRANLRARIFGPADQARTERLSQKLAEVAAQPKPERLEKVELDNVSTEQNVKSHRHSKENVPAGEGMDIDEETASAKVIRKKSSSKTTHRIHKKPRRQKPHAQMIFSSVKKHKRLQNQAQKKKTR